MVDIDAGKLHCSEQSPDVPKVFRSLAIALCWWKIYAGALELLVACHPCQQFAAAKPLFVFPQHSNTTWHQHLAQRPTWQPILHLSSQGLMPGLSYSPAGQQTGHGEREKQNKRETAGPG